MNEGTKSIISFLLEDWKLLLLLTLVFLIYFHYTSTFDFFEKKGIQFRKPVLFFGNYWPRIIGKTSYHDFQLEIYNNFRGKPYGGKYGFNISFYF